MPSTIHPPASSTPDVPVAPDAEGAATAAWTRAVALPLVRGLSHALSNRVGAVGALLEIILDPDSSPADRAAHEHQLRQEMTRLGEINAQLRMVAPDRAPVEPLLVADAVEVAASLAALHRDRRGGELQVRVEGAAPPVKLSRWALIHSLVAMLDATGAASGSTRLCVTLGSATGVATIRVAPDDATHGRGEASLDRTAVVVRRDPTPGREAAEHLAGHLGGVLGVDPDGALELRVPTLEAMRARARGA